jgi:hypothetical protein
LVGSGRLIPIRPAGTTTEQQTKASSEEIVIHKDMRYVRNRTRVIQNVVIASSLTLWKPSGNDPLAMSVEKFDRKAGRRSLGMVTHG